jgi:hypothetical protein
MRITNKPVDVSALRQEWIAVVDRGAASGVLDAKTQRIARRCCFRSIAIDLRRYDGISTVRLLAELFGRVVFAVDLAYRIHYEGPNAAAAWLEEQLGVKLGED